MQDSLQIIEHPCPICDGPTHHAYTGEDRLHGIDGEFRYAECENCGAVFQYPMPDIERIHTFYPADYKPYARPLIRPPNTLKRAVLAGAYGYEHLPSPLPNWLGRLAAPFIYRKSIPFVKDGTLLDVGCGSGKFLAAMRQLGWRTSGVEFNPLAVEFCRRAGLDVHPGELREAEFADALFDAITANHVIEHIAEPRAFLAEIARVLKPGGTLYLRTPNSRALGRPWFGACWFANDIPRHLILYHKQNLARLAADAGLQRQKASTRSTPKILLNSWDACRGAPGKPSRKRPLRRLPGKLYAAVSSLVGRGDELLASFSKNDF